MTQYVTHNSKGITDEQYIEALNNLKEGSTLQKEADKLGVSIRAITKRRRKLIKRGLWEGGNGNQPVPEPYYVKGKSQYYNKDGNPAGVWVKSELDKQRLHEMMLDAIDDACKELPRLKPIPSPELTLSDFINLYTLSDLHVGMLCSHRENLQSNWDLKIAEETIIDCFGRMIATSIDAEECIINQLGDMLHTDGMMPVTPTSKHILDTDGRFGKVVEAAIRIMRKIVDMALHKHSKVTLIIAEGNHDIASSIWLRRMFCVLYENEPRVKVIDSDLPYYVTTFGETMIGAHHGHLKNNSQLPLLFAAQFAKEWGSTTKRYCHTGHRHHLDIKEYSGMTVIQHPTLAARDSHASRGGWQSDSRAISFTYHKTQGEVAANYVYPIAVK